MSQKRIIRKPEVLYRLGISKSTLYYRIKDNLLPPPISLGGRAVGWLESEVDSILNALVAGRPENEIEVLVSELVICRGSAR